MFHYNVEKTSLLNDIKKLVTLTMKLMTKGCDIEYI